jgi:hypothetical protein
MLLVDLAVVPEMAAVAEVPQVLKVVARFIVTKVRSRQHNLASSPLRRLAIPLRATSRSGVVFV